MVPNGWSKLSLKKLLTLNYGKSPKEIIDENGAYDIVGTGGITGSTNKYLHSEPSVIIGRKGTIDKPQYLDKPFWAIDTTFYCVPIDNNKVDIKWFYQYSKLINWKNYNEASGVPSLSRETIYSIQVATPPIAEQLEIVKVLSTWDKAISTTERLIDNSTQQKKALMQQLLTGKRRLLNSEGKSFEDEWEELTFDEALTKLTDYTANGSFASLAENVTVYDSSNYALWIMGRTLKSENYLNDVRYTDKKGYEFLKKTKLYGGELLMPKTGDVGKAYLFPYLNQKATLADNVFLLDFKDCILNKFARYYINGEIFQYKLGSMMYGTSQQTIVKKSLRKMLIPVPSLEEQQKIVNVLINADKEIELLEQQLADLQQEKKSLMQVLLTGKVRVVVGGDNS